MKKIIIVFLFIAANSLSQSLIRVPSDYLTIQAAIDAAINKDTILVDEGTYNEEIDFLGKNILLTSNYLFSTDTTHIFNTIINGNSGSVVSFINGEDSTCVLIGFTLKSGAVGIQCQSSSPSIINCIIRENYFWRHFDGGIGIECYGSNPTIFQCSIVENIQGAGSYGGGWSIYTVGASDNKSSPKIINTTVAWNKELYGGGIRCIYSEPIIVNSIIWNNGEVSVSTFQSQPIIVYSDIEGGWLGEGNIDVYPMFTDTLTGNFTLSENSPCIDAGTELYIIDGDTILNLPANSYHGLAPDMGFMESPYPVWVKDPLVLPNRFFLSQNYPNPFNPVTSIQYAIGSRQFVTLKIYDVLGNEIATLVNEEIPAGNYEVEFNASSGIRDLVSGIYFYQLKSTLIGGQAGKYIETKKMVLLK